MNEDDIGILVKAFSISLAVGAVLLILVIMMQVAEQTPGLFL